MTHVNKKALFSRRSIDFKIFTTTSLFSNNGYSGNQSLKKIRKI